MKRFRPARFSAIHSSAKDPSWMAVRILPICSRTWASMTMGPRVTSPYSAVSEIE